jgi:hypothetical protein
MSTATLRLVVRGGPKITVLGPQQYRIALSGPARYRLALTARSGPPGHTPVLTWVGDQIAIDGETAGPHLTGPQGLQGPPGVDATQMIPVVISGATTLTTAHAAKLVRLTATTNYTLTLAPAATLGEGWYCRIENTSSSDIQLAPTDFGIGTIDDRGSFVMYPGERRLVWCDGTAFFSIVEVVYSKVYTASDGYQRPPGYRFHETWAWGGGGSGAKGSHPGYAGAGAGGYCAHGVFADALVPDLVPITIGAGGQARTADGGGEAGGTTTFGSLLTAFGGGGGGYHPTSNTVGGSGAGAFSPGLTPASGSQTAVRGGEPQGSLDSASGTAYISNNSGHGGAAGGSTTHGGGSSVWGGAGGAGSGSSGLSGGNSIYGGAGGGTPPQAYGWPAYGYKSGGTSRFGGNGGHGQTDGDAGDGAAPGGGGGACGGTGTRSGAGGRGELRVKGVI